MTTFFWCLDSEKNSILVFYVLQKMLPEIFFSVSGEFCDMTLKMKSNSSKSFSKTCLKRAEIGNKSSFLVCIKMKQKTLASRSFLLPVDRVE